jgi:hypothetical protein
VTHADLVFIERFDHGGNKLGQFQSTRDVPRIFASTGGNLLDAVLGFTKSSKARKRNSPGGGLAEIEAQLFGPAKLGGRWQQRGCWFASAMAAYCLDEIVE